jgi:2-oxoglutarate dehydrogenase E1 component
MILHWISECDLRDVFIDLLGYRKYGHNEGDEPRFTQPVLYKIIAKHKNPRDLYADKLADGIIDAGHVKVLKRNTKLI